MNQSYIPDTIYVLLPLPFFCYFCYGYMRSRQFARIESLLIRDGWILLDEAEKRQLLDVKGPLIWRGKEMALPKAYKTPSGLIFKVGMSFQGRQIEFPSILFPAAKTNYEILYCRSSIPPWEILNNSDLSFEREVLDRVHQLTKEISNFRGIKALKNHNFIEVFFAGQISILPKRKVLSDETGVAIKDDYVADLKNIEQLSKFWFRYF